MTHEGDDPERAICVAVATPIQAMAVLPSRRRVNRRYTAERSKRRLTREALEVVARGARTGLLKPYPSAARFGAYERA